MGDTQKLNNLKEVLDSRGIKANFIAKELDINPQTVYNWLHQRSQPSLKTLHLIADLINIPVTDLINSNKEEN